MKFQNWVFEFSNFIGCYGRRRNCSHQNEISDTGNGKADKPSIAVHSIKETNRPPQLCKYRAAPCQCTTQKGGDHRAEIPAGSIAICSPHTIKIAEREPLLANQPIVYDEHGADRTHAARVAHQPAVDITLGVFEQTPRLNQNP